MAKHLSNPSDLQHLESMEQPYRMLSCVQAMNTIQRYGLFPTMQKQNIADHTGRCVILAIIIAAELDLSQMEAYQLVHTLAFHDVHEVITGDAPYPTKNFSAGMKSAYCQMETTVDASIAEGYTDALSKLLCNEGFVGPKVETLGKIIDMLELTLFCTNEAHMGNIHILPVLAKGVSSLAIGFNIFRNDYQLDLFPLTTCTGAILAAAKAILEDRSHD